MERSWRRRLVIGAAVLLLGGIIGAIALLGGDDDPSEITVMSRNLYLGADLTPVFQAEADASLLDVIDETWNAIVASDFPTRAGAVADEIVEADADLVGLQEAMRYELEAESGTTEIDFAELLLTALADRGADYRMVVEQNQFGGVFPTAAGLVRLVDRDVILVREAADVELGNEQSGQFEARLTLPNPLGGADIAVPRGWTSVDVGVGGDTFRFVNTHLEAFDPEIRLAQARELVAGPLDDDFAIVLVGDLNSPAGEGPAYQLMVDQSGFEDAWTTVGNGEGFTCCWEGDLRTVDELDERIDLVLTRGEFGVEATDVTGDDEADRVTTAEEPAGDLWPSDHAGVVATLTF